MRDKERDNDEQRKAKAQARAGRTLAETWQPFLDELQEVYDKINEEADRLTLRILEVLADASNNAARRIALEKAERMIGRK